MDDTMDDAPATIGEPDHAVKHSDEEEEDDDEDLENNPDLTIDLGNSKTAAEQRDEDDESTALFLQKDEFANSKHDKSPVPELQGMQLQEDLQETYGYRLRRPEDRNVPTTYVDTDETENYDPEEEKMQQRKRHKSKPRNPFLEEGDEDEEVDKVEKVVRERPKLIICLRFKVDEGTSKLHELLQQLKNRPVPAEYDFASGRRLRNRAAGHLKDAELDEEGEVREHILANPTGHPAARGCVQCLKLGQHCSIIDEEKHYPCLACQEVGEDCVLIRTPVRKEICEKCKRTKTTCSFEYTADHTGRCWECAKDKFPCVAAPVVRYIPTRVRLDHDWKKNPKPRTEIPPPPAKIYSCKACRSRGDICSFTAGRIEDPTFEDCVACEMKRVSCSFVSLDEPMPEGGYPGYGDNKPLDAPTPANSTSKTIDPPSARPLSTAPSKKRKSEGTSTPTTAPKKPKDDPRTITITTRFNHPIIYNSTAGPCTFCPPTSIPIIGQPIRQIQVRTTPSSLSLTENPPNPSPTRICISCTTDRLLIHMCASHTLAPLPNPNPLKDYIPAFEALFAKNPRTQDRWCVICINLAEYECTTPGPRQTIKAGTKGCGLALCGRCKKVFDGQGGGLDGCLGVMMDGSTAERPLGLRADWEMLKGDSELVRFARMQASKR